jgi:hypothetical protein
MSRFRLWCDVPYGLFGLGHMACIVDDHPKPAAASLLPMPRGAPVAIVVVSITLTPVKKLVNKRRGLRKLSFLSQLP